MYEIGEWIKCTKDHTGLCKVGESYQIVDVTNDRSLVGVEYEPGKIRKLWTTLKGGFKSECEPVGESHGSSGYEIY